MGQDLFSVPIFFIVLRETIEGAIIVSVLLSFVEQLMTTGQLGSTTRLEPGTSSYDTSADDVKRTKQIVKRMRIQIWAGAFGGFLIALAIGAAFIAVFYTKVTDLWANTEQIWEGTFSLVACILIYLMGVAFLKMDRSRVKWRIKLADAFEKSHHKAISARDAERSEGRSGKWALFLLPFITVLREGLEAVVFVGGVSLNQSGKSIPLAVIAGLICGSLIGYIIYRTGSSSTLHWFLIGSTTFLFLIGAGLASKGVGFFQYYRFAKGVGGDVSETGDGPGSFQVDGNVWHLTYGNPETGSPTTNGGWQLFNSIFGWNNTATQGTILAYVFYWLLIIVTLIYLRWKEGRVSLFGYTSKAGKERKVNGHANGRSYDGYEPADSPPSGPETEDVDRKKTGDSPGAERGVPILEN